MYGNENVIHWECHKDLNICMSFLLDRSARGQLDPCELFGCLICEASMPLTHQNIKNQSKP